MQVVDRHRGVLGRDGVDGALPEAARVSEHVGLVHEGELLALALCRRLEAVANEPLNAESRVDGDLVGDLLRRANANRAAVAHVRSLCTLAHDHEVDRARIGQR